MYINQSNIGICLNVFLREKKAVLLWIPNEISIEVELPKTNGSKCKK